MYSILGLCIACCGDNKMISAVERISNSKQSPSFGHLKPEVKTLLNQCHVRTALKKYGVTKQDIRALDESSLRFSLLSSLFKKTNLPPGWEVSQYSGLFLRVSKKSKLSNVVITVPEADLGKADTDFFAFCVSKAKEMEQLYRDTLKKVGNHSVSKAKSQEITQVERQVKKDLRTYVSSYQNSDDEGMRSAYGRLKSHEMKEIKIDSKYKVDLEQINIDFMNDVSAGWDKINHKEYIEKYDNLVKSVPDERRSLQSAS